MSELFIKQLAMQVARHPDFQNAMEVAISSVLMTVITREFAGERFNLYVANRPASMRRERDNSIRSEWNGKNCTELSKRHRLTPRMVRRIATGR